MPFKTPLLILLASLSLHVAGQVAPVHVIKGTVTDTLSGVPLAQATIVCMLHNGGGPVHSARSNNDGFVFRLGRPGTYNLIATYLGYLPDTVALTISAHDTAVVVVNFKMRRSLSQLMQVVVRATIPPVIVKADTIAFNANSFPNRPYASVEDLLRKLPGIAIDREGNVTIQGKKIDKIMIDGKEFFLGDIKTATQNLPAEMVAQVDAFDTESEMGKLTGIRDNTGGKTLNIRLKKNRKGGYFGKVYGGGGNAQSYAAGGTAASLGEGKNFFVNGEANNINNQFTGTENNSGPWATGINTFSNGNVNYRDKVARQLTAIVNAGYYHNNSSLLSASSRQTFLADSSLVENRQNNVSNANTSGRVDARFEYTADSLTTLNVQSRWINQSSENNSTDTVGIVTQTKEGGGAGKWPATFGLTRNTSHSSGHTITNSLDFRHQFHKKGRTFYLGLSQSSQQQQQKAGLYSLVNSYDTLGNLTLHTLQDQRSKSGSGSGNVGARVSYTEPVSRQHILDFGYRIFTVNNKSDKRSVDYDSTTGQYDKPNTLTSNKFSSRNTVQQFLAGFNTDGPILRYQLGFAFQLTGLANKDYSAAVETRKRFTNWFPRANLIWILGQGRTFRFDYRGIIIVPAIDQLQPLPDLTNPFLVRLGNPALKPAFQHALDLEYTSFKARSLNNWQINVQGNFASHAITPATTLLAGGVQQLQYVNLQGNYDFSSNLTYGFPIWAQHSNGSIGLHGSFNHLVSMLNGKQYYSNATTVGATAKFNYHPMAQLFFDFNGVMDYSANEYALDAGQNTHTVFQTYSLNLAYELPLAINVSTFYYWQRSGAQGAFPARTTSYWNAAVYRTIFRNHGGQIRLSVFNLLDRSHNISQYAGNNYIGTSMTNLPGRLFLLSVVWHFRKFPPQR